MTAVNVFMMLMLMLLLSMVSAADPYYRGGTISWSWNGKDEVQLSTRMGWEFRQNGCDEMNIGSYVSDLSGEFWRCISGCTGTPTVSDQGYNCVCVSRKYGWEQGENRFTFTAPSSKQFVIGYNGEDWPTLGYGIPGPSYIQTTIDLRMRNDTRIPNSSPVTASLPVYNVGAGCVLTIQVPVQDDDSDDVRCRWSRVDECMHVCSDNSSTIPRGNLNEANCTLTLDAQTTNGYHSGQLYAVAVTLEDLPLTDVTLDGQPSVRTKALSSVPLQFLIKVETYGLRCSNIPRIVDCPPDGTRFIIPNAQSWSQRIYVQGVWNSVPGKIKVSGPYDLHQSGLQTDDKLRPATVFMELSWLPTPRHNGINIVCFLAQYSSGQQSEQRCYFLLAGATDPCDSDPCMNNSTCSINQDTFLCTCPSGITGSSCETDIDECLLSPCQNGAMCSNIVGGYECSCKPGWAGQNCSYADHCASYPCGSYGQCINNGYTYTCTCHHGYSGTDCQTDVDDCASAPCRNGATCRDLVDDFHCGCSHDFSGKICDQSVDFCDPSPCQNGGICSKVNDGYLCTCSDDVIGLNCEGVPSKACADDESYCTCIVDGKPARVPVQSVPEFDDSREQQLLSGILGYPIGLLLGSVLCGLFHCCILPRCREDTPRPRPRERPRPSSTSSTSTLVSANSRATSVTMQPNIYRTGFCDDNLFQTSKKKNPQSYTRGDMDWNAY